MPVNQVVYQHFLPWHGGQWTLPVLFFPHVPVVFRLVTTCWFWTCLPVPFRNWQGLVSASPHPCESAVLLSFVSWAGCLKLCVIPWPANLGAINTLISHSPFLTSLSGELHPDLSSHSLCRLIFIILDPFVQEGDSAVIHLVPENLPQKSDGGPSHRSIFDQPLILLRCQELLVTTTLSIVISPAPSLTGAVKDTC